MNLPSSERVCVFRRRRDNQSVSSTGTQYRGTSAMASRVCACLRSRPAEVAVFHPNLFKTKCYINLSNTDQHHSHCLWLLMPLVLMQGVWIKGQVLPASAHGRGMQVATELPGAQERTSAQPCRFWLLGYSCVTPPSDGWLDEMWSQLALGWENRGGPEFLKGKFCVRILKSFRNALPLATARQLHNTGSQNQNRCSSKTKAEMNVKRFAIKIILRIIQLMSGRHNACKSMRKCRGCTRLNARAYACYAVSWSRCSVWARHVPARHITRLR